jgi:hypothetical protein
VSFDFGAYAITAWHKIAAITAGIYDRRNGVDRILRGNNPQDRMSALGQKQTSEEVWPMSALPPKADIPERDWNVR